MGIEQSAIRQSPCSRFAARNARIAHRATATAMGAWPIEAMAKANGCKQLPRSRSYSHFPLTCEGSIRTFYAFSGVETAGEQEAQESCFPVRALTGSKLAAQSNF